MCWPGGSCILSSKLTGRLTLCCMRVNLNDFTSTAHQVDLGHTSQVGLGNATRPLHASALLDSCLLSAELVQALSCGITKANMMSKHMLHGRWSSIQIDCRLCWSC